MTHLPVELAPTLPELRPSRWIVFWLADDAGHWRETLFTERPLAEAYATAKRGRSVPFAAMAPLPEGMR